MSRHVARARRIAQKLRGKQIDVHQWWRRCWNDIGRIESLSNRVSIPPPFPDDLPRQRCFRSAEDQAAMIREIIRRQNIERELGRQWWFPWNEEARFWGTKEELKQALT